MHTTGRSSYPEAGLAVVKTWYMLMKEHDVNRLEFEQKLWAQKYKRIMGLDEVGRGCLCGPVVAAGVVFKPGSTVPAKLRDSKTLTESDREGLVTYIKSEALFWTIQSCTPAEIDRINILQASLKAMMKCAEKPGAEPDYLLVDGNRFTTTMIPHSCIVKGDNRSASIAAASVLAKVYRDTLMRELHNEYPVFGWDRNVGYPTPQHLKALEKYGYTKHHRTSFKLPSDKRFSLPVDTE